MQILISCAKKMSGIVPRLLTGCTDPVFERYANHIAMQLSRYTADELQHILRCSHEIAVENRRRYQRFIDPSTRRPAIFNYHGIVYQAISPDTLTDDDLAYANHHLLIGSFLYGLLRPLDLINQYRLEGNVVLPTTHQTIFEFWRPVLTDYLIDTVRADDGILINLASNEFQKLFDWKRVLDQITVVTPDLGPLASSTVALKQARGNMVRHIITNHLTSPADIY